MASLLHGQDAAESALSRQHMIHSIFDLIQRELLDHAVDVEVLGEALAMMSVYCTLC